MTASSSPGPAQLNGLPVNSLSRSSARHQAQLQQQQQQQTQSSCSTIQNNSTSTTSTFQQVKQTQASLARQSHVHQQLQAAINSNNNNNNISISSAATNANAGTNISQNQQQQPPLQQQSNHVGQASHNSSNSSQSSQQQKPAATFVDCLIRRFKNCFNEDFCTVPMFVVGNLSPGIDGTHLILPPCVSLGRQGINRFSSPKNLRLMNSIRESCRSIEDLDLGGNKLNDLIEVYKILQLTPNLRFLNLSENDLSRTAPVAMATSGGGACPQSSGGGATALPLTSSSFASAATAAGQWGAAAPTATANNGHQRYCLAPLNQNMALGCRRHSTLCQSASVSSRAAASSGAPAKGTPLRLASGASRVAEARRLAAANALAQSKKTSSSVASKLASSAAAAATVSSTGAAVASRPGAAGRARHHQGGARHLQAAGRQQASPTPSTMHLARSLSSLSAKDIRSHHHYRGTKRNESPNGVSSNWRRGSAAASAAATVGEKTQQIASRAPIADHKQLEQDDDKQAKATCKIATSSSHHLLYVDATIVETDNDVDMSSEQQLSPSGGVGAPGRADGVQSSGSLGPQVATLGNHHASVASSPQSAKVVQSNANNQKNSPTSSSASPLFNLPNNGATNTGSQVSSSNNNNNNNISSSTSSINTSFRRTFESIKALALNNTGCPWRVVCSILSRMPNLEELHLSLNNYERIDLEPNEFKHTSLRRLYLCNNPNLTNWEELDKLLIAFPSLEALSIANCNISQIPDNLDRAREWRKLCGLNINGWPIKEWPVVERLNQLPSLIDLRCRNLEVLQTIDEPRHHLIARLPKLQRLNGSEIEEREEAEKAFVRFFMANSHLERPSRFHELMQIYGEISTVDVDVDLSPPSRAQVRIIYLNRSHYRKENNDDIMMSEDFLLKLMDNANSGRKQELPQESDTQQQQQQQETSCETAQENSMEIGDSGTTVVATTGSKTPVRLFKDEGQEIVALNVDLRQSVRKFKSNLATLFGLDGQSLILYYIDHEMVGLMGPELLKHNQKKLWNYNVQDGDQFIVEEL